MRRVGLSAYRSGLFRGRTAIVTGGATGIGYAIASELALLGADVLLASRNEAKLQAATAQLRQAQLRHNEVGGEAGSIHYHVTNIRKEADVTALFEAAENLLQRPPDCLVNNGGGQFPSPAEAISSKGWNAVVETNLTGTFLCCREFKRARAAGSLRGGAIVNITCDSMLGFPGMAHTGAARAGVENLTKSLAMEWASDGLRVNAVAPGVIWSESAAANYPSADFLTRLRDRIPWKRLGTPSEVSAAAVFLLSDATASYITGTTLRVDGACPLNGPVAWLVPEHENAPPPPPPLADDDDGNSA